MAEKVNAYPKSYIVNVYHCATCRDGKEYKGNGAWSSHWKKHLRAFDATGSFRLATA